MAVPSFNDLRYWVGELFTNEDWDFNLKKIAGWFSDGAADLVINSLKVNNGIDANNTSIINLKPASNGTGAVSLDQAQTLLNRTSYFQLFSIAAGKIDSQGNADYLQKDSDVQLTILAGGINPDLVLIHSDGTVETLTQNTVLNIPSGDGTYFLIKEKEENAVITSGTFSSGLVFPSSPNDGDYFLNTGVLPFAGYKYKAVGGWESKDFILLGKVVKISGTASLKPRTFNQNYYNVTTLNNLIPDYSKGVSFGNGYICPYQGLIYMNGAPDIGTSSFYVNGVYFEICFDTGDGASRGNLAIPVNKGDVITFGAGVGGAKFYPMRGGSDVL